MEEIGTKGKKAFTNYDELWEILSTSVPLSSTLRGEGKIKKKVPEKNAGDKGGGNLNKN